MVDSTNKVLAEARKAFGHVDGRTDLDCLVLRIIQLERFRDERLELMNLNARQSQKISRLESRG